MLRYARTRDNIRNFVRFCDDRLIDQWMVELRFCYTGWVEFGYVRSNKIRQHKVRLEIVYTKSFLLFHAHVVTRIHVPSDMLDVV